MWGALESSGKTISQHVDSNHPQPHESQVTSTEMKIRKKHNLVLEFIIGQKDKTFAENKLLGPLSAGEICVITE